MKPLVKPKATWKVTLDGKDMTGGLSPRLVSLTLAEKRTDAADQLDIVITDHDGKMVLPRKGVILNVSLGWEQGHGLPSGLVDKGSFRVDEIKHSGPPDIITITARSANFTSDLRIRRGRSFVGQTLGHVIGIIAADNGLKARVDPTLAGKTIPALGHTHKSDAALLQALGKRFDAVSTVKAGFLLFAPIGSGKTATGKTIPTVTIDRADLANGAHNYGTEDRGQYGGCEAVWHDKASAADHTVTAGGGTGKPKRLRRTYHTEADARHAAEAENTRIGRGKAVMDFTLPIGRPDYFPDVPVKLTGWKAEIIAHDYVIEEISHTMDDSGGLTSKLKLEAKS